MSQFVWRHTFFLLFGEANGWELSVLRKSASWSLVSSFNFFLAYPTNTPVSTEFIIRVNMTSHGKQPLRVDALLFHILGVAYNPNRGYWDIKNQEGECNCGTEALLFLMLIGLMTFFDTLTHKYTHVHAHTVPCNLWLADDDIYMRSISHCPENSKYFVVGYWSV